MSLVEDTRYRIAGTEVVEKKLNGPKLSNILDENLVQSTQDLRLDRRFTF